MVYCTAAIFLVSLVRLRLRLRVRVCVQPFHVRQNVVRSPSNDPTPRQSFACQFSKNLVAECPGCAEIFLFYGGCPSVFVRPSSLLIARVVLVLASCLWYDHPLADHKWSYRFQLIVGRIVQIVPV